MGRERAVAGQQEELKRCLDEARSAVEDAQREKREWKEQEEKRNKQVAAAKAVVRHRLLASLSFSVCKNFRVATTLKSGCFLFLVVFCP